MLKRFRNFFRWNWISHEADNTNGESLDNISDITKRQSVIILWYDGENNDKTNSEKIDGDDLVLDKEKQQDKKAGTIEEEEEELKFRDPLLADWKLDIIDISRVIDIHAEYCAVEDFENEMRNSKSWNIFSKTKWEIQNHEIYLVKQNDFLKEVYKECEEMLGYIVRKKNI